MNYKCPTLISLEEKTIPFLTSTIEAIPITLSSIETTNTDRTNVISNKLDGFKGVFTKHGMLLDYKILREPILMANISEFNGNAYGSVWIDGKFYLPATGTVINNARFEKFDEDTGAIYNYYGTKIMVFRKEIDAEVETELVPGSYHTLECISSTPELGKSEVTVIAKPFRLMNIPIMSRNIKVNGNKMLKFAPYMSKKNDKYTNVDIENYTEFFKKFDMIEMQSFDQFYKQIVNPYELIMKDKEKGINYEELYTSFHSGVKNPISRAYFKALEILVLHGFTNKVIKKAATLGDAPGGFAQCIGQVFPEAKIMTTSLNIEGAIKYAPEMSKNKRIKIDTLVTGTGDLLNEKNLRYLHETHNDLDLILCDGALGYDSEKEVAQSGLLLAEIIAVLGMLNVGGSACFKLYKTWNRLTLDIFHVLVKYFEVSLIYKCRASRIASSETFFVAKRFIGISNDELNELLAILASVINGKINRIFEGNLETGFHNTIMNFNTFYDCVSIFHHQLMIDFYYSGMNSDVYRKIQINYAKKFLQ